MTKKFAVTYEIDYTHRVVVGFTAPDSKTAKQLASAAFDEGTIWDDTEDMPLLFDDYEEVDGETLLFSTIEVSWFPEPDSSVKAIKQKEFAFYACQALLAGCCDSPMILRERHCLMLPPNCRPNRTMLKQLCQMILC